MTVLGGTPENDSGTTLETFVDPLDHRSTSNDRAKAEFERAIEMTVLGGTPENDLGPGTALYSYLPVRRHGVI